MKASSNYNTTICTLFVLFSYILLYRNSAYASGGKFWEKEKLDHNFSISYTFMTPTGKFANNGREGKGNAMLGHGFELEYMYYHAIEHDENWRYGIGGSIPFFFIPINKEKLNPQLTTAFANDPYSNTNFIPTVRPQWFAWGIGAEGSLMYTSERFSAETTLKIGNMMVYAPRYKITDGSYVPTDYVQYFPYEGGGKRGVKSIYFNIGMQATVFITDEFAVFAGIGFQWMRPEFEKDLMYVNMVNNEPTVERKNIEVDQPMQFFHYRLGLTFNIPAD